MKKQSEEKKQSLAEQELANVRREFESMRSMLKKSVSDLNKLTIDACKMLASYEDSFKIMKKTNESVEETLINVLMAIRQNEYLQAECPAQHGFPAMKIIGTHPAKLTKI